MLTWQYHDYDNMTRLPLSVINYLCINNIEAYVCASTSKTGLHLKYKSEEIIAELERYSDERYEHKKGLYGMSLLWRKYPWYRVEKFGVYER